MKKLLPWLPAALWMGFIYLMSAAPGDISGAQSGRLVRLIASAYGFASGGASLAPDALHTLETLVRKAAHMGEYAVLSLLYARALTQNGAKRPALASLILCALYAATDEIHQAFVPDRGPAVTDVAIDTLGASLGLLFRLAVSRYRRAGSRTPIS